MVTYILVNTTSHIGMTPKFYIQQTMARYPTKTTNYATASTTIPPPSSTTQQKVCLCSNQDTTPILGGMFACSGDDDEPSKGKYSKQGPPYDQGSKKVVKD